MKNTENDRRVLRTKKQLKNALLRLLKEKPMDKITTSELCTEAGINRNTFYTHYKNPNELLTSIEEQFFHNLFPSFEVLFEKNDRHKALVLLCDVIYRNKDVCLLIERHADTTFIAQIVEFVKEPAIRSWREMGFTGSDDDMNILYSFITAGCKSSLIYWMTSENTKTPEQMARFIELTALFGLSRFIRKKN